MQGSYGDWEPITVAGTIRKKEEQTLAAMQDDVQQRVAAELRRIAQNNVFIEDIARAIIPMVLEHAAKVAYVTCAAERQVTLGDKAAAAIRAIGAP